MKFVELRLRAPVLRSTFNAHYRLIDKVLMTVARSRGLSAAAAQTRSRPIVATATSSVATIELAEEKTEDSSQSCGRDHAQISDAKVAI